MLGTKSFAFGLSVVLAFIAPEVLCEEAAANKLEVKVYYEALCWDSIQFMRNLQRSMTGKDRLPYTDLKFVPYGKVVMYNDSKTNETVLDCQHGRRECELNALHACIIENNTEQESYEMITCLMWRFTYVPSKCAARYGINLDAANRCKQTRTVVDILKSYGDDTYAVGLSFVPTITFDGVYDYYEQDDILRNFDRVFCNKYKNKFNVTLAGC